MNDSGMLEAMTNGHLWVSPCRTLLFALAACLALSRCTTTTTSPGSCPSYLVQLDTGNPGLDAGSAHLDGGPNSSDGGIGGFSSVGEWRIDSVCQNYCASDYPVCQLVNEGTVKCQKGCA